MIAIDTNVLVRFFGDDDAPEPRQSWLPPRTGPLFVPTLLLTAPVGLDRDHERRGHGSA